jgi:hypothetical protein
MASPIPQDELFESLRAEYKAGLQYAVHTTEINWQVGSILVGGSLAAVALTVSAHVRIPTILITFSAIIAIVAWFLFLRRNRDIGDIIAGRMRAIEIQLGLGWGVWNLVGYNRKTIHGPMGYTTAQFLVAGLILSLSTLIVYLIFFPIT